MSITIWHVVHTFVSKQKTKTGSAPAVQVKVAFPKKNNRDRLYSLQVGFFGDLGGGQHTFRPTSKITAIYGGFFPELIELAKTEVEVLKKARYVTTIRDVDSYDTVTIV